MVICIWVLWVLENEGWNRNWATIIRWIIHLSFKSMRMIIYLRMSIFLISNCPIVFLFFFIRLFLDIFCVEDRFDFSPQFGLQPKKKVCHTKPKKKKAKGVLPKKEDVCTGCDMQYWRRKSVSKARWWYLFQGLRCISLVKLLTLQNTYNIQAVQKSVHQNEWKMKHQKKHVLSKMNSVIMNHVYIVEMIQLFYYIYVKCCLSKY